ncbi:MAG TPA: DUF2071 domain-containing protein, partial [Longimicrobiaceae bacterium]|nr:DUF2071 domain-containing protein [Longimicrobiaceae bacterium]
MTRRPSSTPEETQAPLPAAEGRPARVFLTAEWRWLAMLNYEADPAVLAPLVPPGTEPDAWRGTTYLSMVGFLF